MSDQRDPSTGGDFLSPSLQTRERTNGSRCDIVIPPTRQRILGPRPARRRGRPERRVACASALSLRGNARAEVRLGQRNEVVSRPRRGVWQRDQVRPRDWRARGERSEEHTSELQSLMRISYAVLCLKKITTQTLTNHYI